MHASAGLDPRLPCRHTLRMMLLQSVVVTWLFGQDGPCPLAAMQPFASSMMRLNAFTPKRRATCFRRPLCIVASGNAEGCACVCPGGSVTQHYLGSYQQSLLAVCLAQFSAKRYVRGMEGVIGLAQSCKPLAALFEQELKLSIPDMLELARSDPGSSTQPC